MPSVSSNKTNRLTRIDLPYKKDQNNKMKSFEILNEDIAPHEKIRTKVTHFMIEQFN